ncbi:MAG: helix-turn-helix transcriptional regulator [Ruminococcus sp.]|jgi:AraC-like DNA-binding protein|nr:helix-turn-helix transcriptional regulator [Ruminococcus flavefaciens]MBP3746532.1 helix-turn-helix transcriptional regulator [Ruminococcus sp.]MBQ1340334.1 helix-turn-helix transcriptional regulator [Ruminococcus sp.]
MIKNLSGDYETVEYDARKYVMLYDNTDYEAYPVHWHSALEIIMPTQNDYIVNVGGVDYQPHENEVLIIPSGELHCMPAVRGRRYIFQCDNAILGELPALEALMRGVSSPLLIDENSDNELQVLAKKTMLDIAALYTSKSELADVRIYMCVLTLLTAVREDQLRRSQSNMECDDDKLNEYSEKFGTVLKYIDNNYMYDITLDELADVAGYSKYHFSRIFKQYNSMSYIQYINARRTKAAEQLLFEPDIPITEVAMRSGFKSLTTFNRIFKDIKHCTPTDFKKLLEKRTL